VHIVQSDLPIDRAEQLLGEWAPQLRTLLSVSPAAGNLAANLAAELRARLDGWIAESQTAAASADAWLKVAPAEPEANLCKFVSLVRAVPDAEEEWYSAFLAGWNALRLTLDDRAMRRRIQERLAHQLEDPTTTVTTELERLQRDLSFPGGN
jgi:hypothetical protein